MAQVQTTNAKQAAKPAPAGGKRGRAKKGEEPFKLLFIDAENKEHSKVVPTTKSIKAIDKAGKVATITIDGLPDAVKQQLAYSGLQRVLVAPLKKDATNVLDTVNKTVKQLSEGTLFASSGKKVGRVFDAKFWVDCFARAMEIAVERKVQNAKRLTDDGRKKLLAILEGSTAQERSVRTKQWMTNPMFVLAKKEVEMARAKQNVAAVGELAGLEF